MIPVQKITPRIEVFIEAHLNDPKKSIAQLARELKMHENTLRNWINSDCVKEEIDRRLKERWANAAKQAQKKMEELMNSPKDDVALRASQYILDSAGYKPKEQVEVSGSLDIEVNITNDD